jgi:hypothetical protein
MGNDDGLDIVPAILVLIQEAKPGDIDMRFVQESNGKYSGSLGIRRGEKIYDLIKSEPVFDSKPKAMAALASMLSAMKAKDIGYRTK